jgi:hypothetical protein
MAGQVRGAQRLTGRRLDEVVPSQRRPRPEHLVGEEPSGVAPIDEATGAVAERSLEL